LNRERSDGVKTPFERVLETVTDTTVMESLPLGIPAGIATKHEVVEAVEDGFTRIIGMRPKLTDEEIEALKGKSDHFDSYRKEGEATIFYLKGKKVFGIFPIEKRGDFRELCKIVVE